MLKKEIRILGLSSHPIGCSKTFFVGVVFRGGLWLDGVFCCVLEHKRRDLLSELAQTIRNCSQYPQLHALVLHEDRITKPNLTIPKLARKINLPILVIARRPLKKPGICLVLVGGKSISVRPIGIDCDRTREIFAVTCAGNSRIPEATRVAELIAKSKPRRL